MAAAAKEVSCLGVYKKSGPPVPPRLGPKPFVSVGTQSSTESAQDVYLEHMPQQQGEVPVRDGLREPWGGPETGAAAAAAVVAQKSWSRTNCVTMTTSLESVRASRDGPAAAAAAATVPATGQSSPTPRRSVDRQASGSTDGPESLFSDESGKSLASPGGKKRPSVAVQVDIPEAGAAVALSDAESGESGRYHSIGVQVEDERRAGRYTRSNSVTTAVQADLEMEDLARLSVFTPEKANRSASSSSRASHSRSGTPVAGHSAFQHVSTQQGPTEKASQTPAGGGKPSHREAGGCAGEPGGRVRRSSSQQHSRSIQTLEDGGGGGGGGGGVARVASPDGGPPPNGGRVSPCVRDGRWFMRLLQSETERLQGWCTQMEAETQDKRLSEEVLGKIRSAVGSAQLLISRKFKQFHGLCQQNLDPDATPRPTSTDLAGFWDLLQLSVENVSTRFHELQQLKAAGWTQATPPPSAKEAGRKLTAAGSVTSRRGGRARGSLSRDKSTSESADKQRAEEARKRLMAAKRAAAGRQSSATESSDNIEIYIPEAQTRL